MKRIILSLIILSSAFSLLAQKVEVRGTVFDENGEPMRFGSSVYTSKSNGTLTDSMGRYSLLVPSNKETTIYFSSLGYNDEFIVVDPDIGQTGRVSGGEFHPSLLTEPCLTVSRHTALRT